MKTKSKQYVRICGRKYVVLKKHFLCPTNYSLDEPAVQKAHSYAYTSVLETRPGFVMRYLDTDCFFIPRRPGYIYKLMPCLATGHSIVDRINAFLFYFSSLEVSKWAMDFHSINYIPMIKSLENIPPCPDYATANWLHYATVEDGDYKFHERVSPFIDYRYFLQKTDAGGWDLMHISRYFFLTFGRLKKLASFGSFDDAMAGCVTFAKLNHMELREEKYL